ncbi:MAG: GFA family protein [Labilithrix sp.]|nr:GFA family protein [Labilithrix sp.]MCW5814951.1 GFA family protein [Labilithrix sp.]
MISREGGCHCGRVRFRVTFDEGAPVHDCDCSICTKKGFLHVIVTKEAFTLLAGADALTTYTFNTGVAKHTFCSTCGVHAFYTPRSHPDGVDVNARCLDDFEALRPSLRVERFHGLEWEASVERIR